MRPRCCGLAIFTPVLAVATEVASTDIAAATMGKVVNMQRQFCIMVIRTTTIGHGDG